MKEYKQPWGFSRMAEAAGKPTEYLAACGFSEATLDSLRRRGYPDHEVAQIEFDLRREELSLLMDMEKLMTIRPKRDPAPAAEEDAPYSGAERELPLSDADMGFPCLVRAEDVPFEEPKWLLKPYFQKGCGTLIQSDPGMGKTAFMCAVAACVSTGRPLLGLPVQDPGDVLILSVEDDPGVLRGRLEANGADLQRCHFLMNSAGLTIADPELDRYIRQTQAKLLILDPLQAFLGAGMDLYRANETRPVLARLFETAKRNDCAVAIVAHLGKAKVGKTPVTQSLGSVDIPAAMRSVLQLMRHPADPGMRAVVQVKCSNAAHGRSIEFRIGDRGGVQFVGLSDLQPEDIDDPRKKAEPVRPPYEQRPVVQVLRHLMEQRPAGGFWSYKEVREESRRLLGAPLFDSISELRGLLDEDTLRQLAVNDDLIVTGSRVGKGNVRGLVLEPCLLP